MKRVELYARVRHAVMFVPLAHSPGHAQVDFGEALAVIGGVERKIHFLAMSPSGTGKTHIALGLGLAACQKGLTVGFITAAALVHELMEARDEKRLLRSSNAPVRRSEANTSVHSSKGRLLVSRVEPRS